MTTTNTAESFAQINEISDKYNETKDCAVKAVAFACNVSYEVAHNALRIYGRKYRKGTDRAITYNAIEALGYSSGFTPNDFFNQYVHDKRQYRGTINNNNIPRKGTFVVHTASHVLTVIDGKVMDWTKGRRHRIKAVYKIEHVSEPKQVFSEEITVPTTTHRQHRSAYTRTSKNNWVVKLDGKPIRYYKRRPKCANNISRAYVGGDLSTRGRLTIEKINN